jgi:TRAP transporter TAXI family solute receptor
MRGALGVLLVLGALVAACSPNDPPGGEGRLSIATGGAGGVYQVYGGGLADLLSDELPDSPTTAETTSASVDNLLLVANGDSDLAFSLGDSAIDAVEGNESFEEPKPLRALATIYSNITHVVVKADSDIETIEDMEGRTISVGSPGSGTEVIALRLLEVAGLDADEDITKRQLGVGESVQALRDGSIEGFFWSGGVPTGAVTDLVTTDDIRILDLQQYLAPMREQFGEAYAEAEVEEGGYEGVPATPTIGVPNVLVVNEAMDEQLAYDITKALYEGKDRLATIVPAAESLDPEAGREMVDPNEVHPGAQRFYEEQGG